jgi:concanavalin A-like lectin/glucanase superfamily protein
MMKGIILVSLLALSLIMTNYTLALPIDSRTFNGVSDNIAVIDKPYTSLTTFTLSVWFKTTKNYVPDHDGGEGMMITKGGWISNVQGRQLNYGIWISDANHLRGGFETTGGTDYILTTSGTKFNDGLWHHGVITYDKVKLKLYTDGVLFKELSTTATPEKNDQNLNIGKNPLSYREGYFKGTLDDVYVWSVALTQNEVFNLYTGNSLAQKSKIVYSNSFGGFGATANGVSSTYHFGPSLSLSGKEGNNVTINSKESIDKEAVEFEKYPYKDGKCIEWKHHFDDDCLQVKK